MPEREILPMDGGYAVLEKTAEDDWDVETYTHWDNLVPSSSLVGCASREEAIGSLDERGEWEFDTPRERLKNYQYALEENCKGKGVPVPDRLPVFAEKL